MPKTTANRGKSWSFEFGVCRGVCCVRFRAERELRVPPGVFRIERWPRCKNGDGNQPTWLALLQGPGFSRARVPSIIPRERPTKKKKQNPNSKQVSHSHAPSLLAKKRGEGLFKCIRSIRVCTLLEGRGGLNTKSPPFGQRGKVFFSHKK